MADFTIKRNDTARSIEATLNDSGGNAVDLTGASVKFIMSPRPSHGSVKVNASATIVDASAGKVRYDWKSGDVNRAEIYDAEWEVTYGDSTVETFPSDGYKIIEIESDLG